MHERRMIQGADEEEEPCCRSDSTDHNGGLVTLRPGEETELVYYTVCTHFFHPEKNDWIQKIHRTGSVLVPRDRPHHQKCVFWNHLYDPDKEEIFVHKLIGPRDDNKLRGGESESSRMRQQKQQRPMKYHEEMAELDQQPKQQRQQRPMKSHEDMSHDLHARSPLVEQRARGSGFKSRHNRSWVEQAFNDDFDDTYSERGTRHTTTSDLDTTNYSTSTFDDSNLLDTGFDARSVDSQSIASGKSGHFPSQYHSQHREHCY